jgi:hypothetical protein
VTPGSTVTVAGVAAGNAALDAVTADPVFRKTAVAYNTGTVVNYNNPSVATTVTGGAYTANAGLANSSVVVNQPSSTSGYIANPVVAAAYYDQPDLSTPYVGLVDISLTGGAGVSALNQSLSLTGQLAISSVTNSYLTNSALSAATDWVFSMPTRRYHTAYAYSYAGATGNGQVYTDYSGNAVGGNGAVGTNYFRYFGPLNTTVSTTNGYQICTKLASGVVSYGREEQVASVTNPGFVVSPGTVAPSSTLSLCGETSVLSFGKASAMLSASVANTVFPAASLPATDGWATFSTLTSTALTTAGYTGNLPIIGYAAEKAVNSAVSAGVSGNFGMSFNHRFGAAN